MPAFCCVVGCSKRAERDKIRFYRIPKALKNRGEMLDALSKERRECWVRALKRGKLSDTLLKNARICAEHFVSGEPAKLEVRDSPDWVPSVNMGYISIKTQYEQSVKRHVRLIKRQTKRLVMDQVDEAGSTAIIIKPTAEMSSKHGGFSCACRGCNSRSGGGDCALFQFPKEAERAKLWMKYCHREDLMAKLSNKNWYKSHKVCERHFESKFFSTNSDVRKRLLPDAYPTLFVPLPGETTEPPRKVVILSESSSNNSEENQVLVERTERGGSVDEVTVPERGLEFSAPIIKINPPAETSTSELRQYNIYTQNVNYGSSCATIVDGSPLRKKMKKTDVPALNLPISKTAKFPVITKNVSEHSRQGAIPPRKIGSQFSKRSKEDTIDQNEDTEDQIDNNDGHTCFKPKVQIFENDNTSPLNHRKKNVCNKEPSESVIEIDEGSESGSGFDFVDNNCQEMDQARSNYQSQKSSKSRRLCRICLGTSGLTHLTKCQSVVALFVSITDIEVKLEDNLPKYMCADCIRKIEGISNFICLAKENDEKLKQTMSIDEEMTIVSSDNEDGESLSVADDTSNMSQNISNHDVADIESVRTKLAAEPDNETPLSPELIILDDDSLENESMVPQLQKRGESDQNNIENDKDFHNKPLEKQSPKLYNDFNCWKCGTPYVGLEMPKAIAGVPRHTLKFYCQGCLKSNECSNKKPSVDETNLT